MPTQSTSRLATVSAAAVVLALFAGSAAAQNLLTNPSFEDPVVVGDGNHIGTVPTGWQIDQGLFNLVREATAFDGGQFVDLTQETGGLPGTYIFQDFTLAAAAPVEFSGYFSGRDAGTGTGRVAIFSGGTEVATAPTVNPTGTNTPWLQSIATSGELAAGTYQFRAFLGDPTNVDLVSVTIVPEPVALSLVALGGLALLARRRRVA